MKTEDKNNVPRVRIAVLGNINVGKSGEFKILYNMIDMFVSGDAWLLEFIFLSSPKAYFSNTPNCFCVNGENELNELW